MTVVKRVQQDRSNSFPSRNLLNDYATPESAIADGIHYIAQLLELGQSMYGHTSGSVQRVGQELEIITGGKASLHLGQQKSYKDSVYGSAAYFSLPVQYNQLIYGYLLVFCDSSQPEQPAISAPIAQLLCRMCALLLHTLEQSAFVESQCRQLDYQVNGRLTKREKEVLALMCNGYDQQSIAEALCISPATVGKHRQHIYSQLGVHSERAALFAAYHTGLFSLVEESLI